MTYEPDPALVEVLASREPRIRAGEPQAYKRAVIRMVLSHIHNRRAALEEIAQLGQDIDTKERD